MEVAMEITSRSFKNGEIIPAKYAMKAIPGGQNISPHIAIVGIPKEARSLALAFVDRHPMARNWVHWLVLNISIHTTEILEGASLHAMPAESIEMINTFGFAGYGGPQPPRGSGMHGYELTFYALSEPFKMPKKELPESELLKLLQPILIEKCSIAGKFENK